MQPTDTIVLEHGRARAKRLAHLRAKSVCSQDRITQELRRASPNTLWISFDRRLTRQLLHLVKSPARSYGRILLLHETTAESFAVADTCFTSVIFGERDTFLPPEELAEVILSSQRSDLIVGGSVDKNIKKVLLWKGDFDLLVVPFSVFVEAGDGLSPDFDKFEVADFGHTVRFGDYEAATDGLLYECDPAFRRRLKKKREKNEKSFGASLRRLRKQRGLRREDFRPLSPKTIARIEQGKVRQVHERTRSILAKHLSVDPAEIESF